MAVMSMGQMYVGDAFGKKWNQAYSRAFKLVSNPVRNLTTDQMSQELLDQLLATAFWMAADELGGVPKRVKESADVPDRPTAAVRAQLDFLNGK